MAPSREKGFLFDSSMEQCRLSFSVLLNKNYVLLTVSELRIEDGTVKVKRDEIFILCILLKRS